MELYQSLSWVLNRVIKGQLDTDAAIEAAVIALKDAGIKVSPATAESILCDMADNL